MVPTVFRMERAAHQLVENCLEDSLELCFVVVVGRATVVVETDSETRDNEFVENKDIVDGWATRKLKYEEDSELKSMDADRVTNLMTRIDEWIVPVVGQLADQKELPILLGDCFVRERFKWLMFDDEIKKKKTK